MKLEPFQRPLLPASKNILALCFLAQTGINGFILILVLFSSFRINTIAQRKTTFAQMVNGETVVISEKDQYWRYPNTIKKFVSNWTSLTFDWDDKLAGTNLQDKGVAVENTQLVTTNTWFGSLLLEPQFGKTIVKTIAELTPPGVFTGNVRSTALITYQSEPREIGRGLWQVDQIATRLLIDRQTGKDERIAFNRTFTVEATEIPTTPLKDSAPLVEQKIYEARSAGLQIIKIEPYTPVQ